MNNPTPTQQAPPAAAVPLPAAGPAPGTGPAQAAQNAQPPDQIKLQAEIDKLQEELADIRNARGWWVNAIRNVKVNEWIIAAAAVAALLIGVFTGLFDATRQALTAQNERLLIEKSNLELKKDQIAAEVKAKEAELQKVKTQLLPFEREEAAIEALRKLRDRKLHVGFSLAGQFEGLRVSVTGMGEKLDFDLIGGKTRRNPAVAEAIGAANSLRSLKGLRISELSLTPDEIPLLTQHRDLETLVIEYATLDKKTAAAIRPTPALRWLTLRSNKVDSLAGWPVFPSVVSLNLRDNPLGDAGLEPIATAFPGIQHLDVEGTNVSDDGLKSLAKLPELLSVRLRRTRVTGQGSLRLLDCPKLNSIHLDKVQITEQILAVFREKRPGLSTYHDDPPPLWSEGW